MGASESDISLKVSGTEPDFVQKLGTEPNFGIRHQASGTQNRILSLSCASKSQIWPDVFVAAPNFVQ